MMKLNLVLKVSVLALKEMIFNAILLWNYRVIYEFHGLSVQLVLDRIFDNADLCISQGSI